MNGESFDLITNKDEIPSAEMFRGPMRMYKATRTSGSASTTSFPGNQIEFRWNINSDERWDPKNSYVRIRGLLSKTGTVPLKISDGVAPQMNMAPCLFQSARLELNGYQISEIPVYMPQVDTLYNRQAKSKSWLDSVGKLTGWWSPDYYDRLNQISGDGYSQGNGLTESKGRDALGFIRPSIEGTDFQTAEYDADGGTATGDGRVTFTKGAGAPALPTLATYFTVGDRFYLDGTYLGTITVVSTGATLDIADMYGADIAAGTDNTHNWSIRLESSETASRRIGYFELRWTPPLSIFKQDKYLPVGEYKLILQSETSSLYKGLAIESLSAKTADTDFAFLVQEVEFFYPRMKAKRIKDLTYYIDLHDIKCQTNTMTSADQQTDFNVEKSTYALTVAFQDGDVNSSTIYSPTKFKIRSNEDRYLSRLRLDYAGQSKSIPDADPKYVVTTATVAGKDYRTQRYVDSLYYAGGFSDTGGSETIEDMDTRGFYYHFDWVKDGSDTSTDVNISHKFDTLTTANAPKILLFNHMRKLAKVVIKDHKVQSVTVEEV